MLVAISASNFMIANLVKCRKFYRLSFEDVKLNHQEKQNNSSDFTDEFFLIED